jgi:hypothetical protein
MREAHTLTLVAVGLVVCVLVGIGRWARLRP